MPTLARETLGGRAPGAGGRPPRGRGGPPGGGAGGGGPPPGPGPPRGGGPAIHLIFYWGVGCPHREEAMPFVARLESEGITVERVEGWARRVSSSRSRRDWR